MISAAPSRPMRLISTSLVLAAAVLSLAAGPAAAKAPCWKTLINDWYDGRIDNTYAVSCYQSALKHLPGDVEAYSSAREDITRALNSALQKQGTKGQSKDILVPPSPSGSNGGGDEVDAEDPPPPDDGDGGTDSGGNGDSGAGPTAGPDAGGDDGTGLAVDTDPTGSEADSLPLPLLILAGLALLLLAAGAAGLVARRVQGRRLPVQPAPAPVERGPREP